jgi:hypothetical protein
MYPYDNSTFNCLPIDDLERGKKYLVRSYVRGRYENRIGTFLHMSKHTYYGYFSVKMPIDGYLTYSFNESSYFYDFVYQKDKIQHAMELRAINTILRQVIGDDSFTY